MLKNVFVVCLLVFAMFCWFPGQVDAQQALVGTLNGTVIGPENQLLPGVQVSISSPALMLPTMSTLTNEKGFFRFPSLPPGTYKVTFEQQGFKTMVQKGIIVNAQKTTTINGLMEITTIVETVTVTGTTPTVDKERTNAVTSLSANFIANIPATRDIGTLFNMVPGVTSDAAHGSGGRDNTYNIDGVNVTDPVTGTRAGSFSMDVAEEIAVQTGGLTAEYGNVRGAVINVITKSGGNNFSGMLSAYYRSDKLQSDNLDGTIFEGQKSGFKKELEPSFSLGGPIIKNKLWFFVTGSNKTQETILTGYPWDTPGVNAPINLDTPMIYGKLTFQLGRNDKLVLSYNWSNMKSDHRANATTRNVDSTWKQETPVNTFNLQFTHFFGNNFFVNVKGAYMGYHLNLMAKNDLPCIYDYTLRQYTKSYGYDDMYTRRRLQIIGDGTLFADNLVGRHEIKFGVEIENSNDIREDTYNRDQYGEGFLFYVSRGVPRYVYHYEDYTRKDKKFAIGAYLQDSWNPSSRLTFNIGLRYDHQEGIIPKQGEDRRVVTYYGETYDPRVLQQFTPLKWDNIAPRLGAIYDLTGDGKTALKANFSRYYGASIMQFFIWVNPNGTMYWRNTIDSNFQVNGPMTQLVSNSASMMDPNCKAPYTDELSVGIERELFKDWKLGVRYIKKWDRDNVEDIDYNVIDFDKLMAGDPLDSCWTGFEAIDAIDPFDGKTITFYNRTVDLYGDILSNPPGADRNYYAIELTLNKRFSGRWSLDASYVYNRSRGLIGTDTDSGHGGEGYFDDQNSHTNAVGDFSMERRHQFKLNATVKGPLGINLSCYYRYLSGQRWARIVYALDLLGGYLNQDGGTLTVYAEPRGSRKLPDISLLDLRVEKAFNLPGKWGRLAIFADIFNVFNTCTATSVQNISSRNVTVSGVVVPFGGYTGYTTPRIIRIGAKYEF